MGWAGSGLKSPLNTLCHDGENNNVVAQEDVERKQGEGGCRIHIPLFGQRLEEKDKETEASIFFHF